MVPIPDKIGFKIKKKVKKDTEGHFIMIKGIICQEDITLINIYAPDQEALKCIKQLLAELNKETDQNTIMDSGLNIPLSDMDKTSK